MYIAALEIIRKQCDAGELIQELRTLDNADKLEPCTEEDRPVWCGYHKDQWLKIQYTERDDKPEYLYYKKADLILVELPPALELLNKAIGKLTAQDTLFQQLKELSER